MAKQRSANASKSNYGTWPIVARATMGLGPYDEKAHKTWCNTYNSGISHFACVSSTYPIENIRFDVFHSRSGTFKVFVSFIRTLLDNTYQPLEDFSEFLLEIKH